MNLIPTVSVQPTFEPVTLEQAKKHLEIATSDDIHDDHIAMLIQTAREQLESDTGLCLCSQTLQVKFESIWDGMQLQRHPIQSVTSLKYYDTNGVQQTLTTTVYIIDTAKRSLRLKYEQDWPDYQLRWDAWEINYVAGYADGSVPALAQAACLLSIGYLFENRDMFANDIIYTQKPYEAIIKRLMRSTYP